MISISHHHCDVFTVFLICLRHWSGFIILYVHSSNEIYIRSISTAELDARFIARISLKCAPAGRAVIKFKFLAFRTFVAEYFLFRNKLEFREEKKKLKAERPQCGNSFSDHGRDGISHPGISPGLGERAL